MQAEYRFNSLLFFFSTSYQTNDKNKDGFEDGDVLRFNSAVRYVFDARMDLIAEINSRHDAFDKENNEKAPNTGGTVVYFSPGMRLRYSSTLSLRGQAQIPVVKKLNREQHAKISFHAGVVWEF